VLLAAYAGYKIERSCVREGQAFTKIHLPYTFKQLADVYERYPSLCLHELGKTIAVYLAGSFVLGEQPTGVDLGEIGLYHNVLKGLLPGGHDLFMRVYQGAEATLRGFFARSRTRECLHDLAFVIERQRELDEHAIATALQTTGCLDVVPPEWPAILPPTASVRPVAQPRCVEARDARPGQAVSYGKRVLRECCWTYSDCNHVYGCAEDR
jgi:hypothetical protein